MHNTNDSKIIDFRKAKMVREKKLPGWYIGQRDAGIESRSIRLPEKPNFRDLPLVGPNRMPPEYLAA
ncbi:MAG: hypothetical protein KC800_29600 [Candidatus Eremiobacteraeota bacterium]|nr:hypothetical protein [Candidatus Eremiobacteraeota bacterium]